MSELLCSTESMELEIIDLYNRIEEAKGILANIPVLSDAGKHRDPNCYRYHLDCLVVKLRNTLEK